MSVSVLRKLVGAAVVVIIVAFGTGCKQERGQTGSFTDSRDGQTYRTVVMPDGKTWMAENLNHKTDSSWCYGDSAVYCDKYGRLYTWDAAMKACPEGWRLPTDAEWTALTEAVGGDEVAGTKLRSKTEWSKDVEYVPYIPGTDNFGFSALPSGYHWDDSFKYVGSSGYWWTATESDANIANRRSVSNGRKDVGNHWAIKDCGFSVRCLRE